MRLLVTGATGALGMALIRALLPSPDLSRLVCYSRSESRQADAAAELPDHPSLRWVLGDVRDVERLEEAMGGCEAVVHAAALKRVDAGAYSPSEMLATNVLGTQRVIRAAVRAGVPRVLVISSDKAVEATNLYGKSKAMAEELAVDANGAAAPRGTRIACTRYGNDLGSTGSVIPIWRRAIAEGKPLRITDPMMTRFWLTLPQAADFVLWALGQLRGGEIFVPVLPAMRIGDLAQVFDQQGRVGHAWQFIGLRPGGEKMHETLISAEEGTRTVAIETVKGATTPWVEGNAWVINPSIHTWRADPPWAGPTWPTGAIYRSDLVPRVSMETMRAWLEATQ